MKTFVISARVDGCEFEYLRHTETAEEALKSWFKLVRGKEFVFLGIHQYAGTMSIRLVRGWAVQLARCTDPGELPGPRPAPLRC
jgi:hypothetical protein